MNSANAVAIHSARLAQMGVNRQVLKEGASVLVRVIGERGNGKYEGSVAGVRVGLTSAKPLQPGDSFIATVSVKNGTIVITPKEIGLLTNGAGEISLSFSEVSEAQLYSLMEALGLPADNLSSSILKSFKQMGLKLDGQLANKIRSLALRFSGKEKSAAEILSLLSQKGLEADEEEINELLQLLQGQESAQNTEKQTPSYEKGKKLVNRINKSEGAWYLFPFELVQLRAEKEASEESRLLLGQGCIRLLFDSQKALKQMNVDCLYHNLKYLFCLTYDGKKISNTSFNVSSTDGKKSDLLKADLEIHKLKTLFGSRGINHGKLFWAEKEELEGSASGLESFVSFGGQI